MADSRPRDQEAGGLGPACTCPISRPNGGDPDCPIHHPAAPTPSGDQERCGGSGWLDPGTLDRSGTFRHNATPCPGCPDCAPANPEPDAESAGSGEAAGWENAAKEWERAAKLVEGKLEKAEARIAELEGALQEIFDSPAISALDAEDAREIARAALADKPQESNAR